MTDPAVARSSATETMSQDEVERLLVQMGSGDGAEGAGRSDSTTVSSSIVRQYVFPRHSLYSASEFRKLRMRHEDFLRSLGARLSVYSRTDVVLQMARLEATTFDKFAESISDPAHIVVFRLEPLKGRCLLDISPRLALTILDRELGGTGQSPVEPRDLSTLESRLLSPFIDLVVAEWCGAWSDFLDLKPILISSESSSRFLEGWRRNTVLLVLSVEVRMQGLSEQIQFAFTRPAVEALLPKLDPKAEPTEQPPPEQSTPGRIIHGPLSRVKLTLKATVGGLQLTARHLASLNPGDILPVSIEMANNVCVTVENIPKFVGTLGSAGQRRAVRIDHVVKFDDQHP